MPTATDQPPQRLFTQDWLQDRLAIEDTYGDWDYELPGGIFPTLELANLP